MSRLAEHSPVKFVKIDSSKQLEESFRFGEEIGKGAFGSVLLADRLVDKRKFAVKKMAKNKDAKSTYGKSWENEIMVLRRFQHDNIVHLEVIYESETNCYLFLELCDAGTLSDELERRGSFAEVDCRCLLRQLGSALNYLHRHCIVHRDLKLQNCLLKNNPNCRQQQHGHKQKQATTPACPFTLKLSDFGLSIELRGLDSYLADNVGTPSYQSPEIVSSNSYSYKCDTWAFGIIFYWMLHGRSPYSSCRCESQLAEAIKQFCFQQHAASCSKCGSISSECRNAISHLLVVSAVERWSVSEFMASAWIMETQQGQRQDNNILEMMRTLNSHRNS